MTAAFGVEFTASGVVGTADDAVVDEKDVLE